MFVAVEKRVVAPRGPVAGRTNPRFTVLVVAGTIATTAYGVTIFLSTVYPQAEVRAPLTR